MHEGIIVHCLNTFLQNVVAKRNLFEAFSAFLPLGENLVHATTDFRQMTGFTKHSGVPSLASQNWSTKGCHVKHL